MEFMRRAPHYLQRLPNQGDTLAWLALARHHGAPSRLLDWSKSLQVAAFFAASEAGADEGCTVWAIDQGLLKRHALGAVKGLYGSMGRHASRWEDLISRGTNFERVFLRQKPDAFFVAPLEPFEASERMIIQQGLFLSANSLAFTFERMLASTLKGASAGRCIRRYQIHKNARHELLYTLDRMNITETTLFPGIDGFARSLRTTVELSGKVRDGINSTILGETQPRPWHS